MNRNAPALTVAGLSRSVGDRLIVEDFSYEFYSGRIYTVLGPSGAGKSSLLRLLNRLDEPTGGEMALGGLGEGECVPCQLRQRVGFLFQTAHLFPKTIRDNLVFARDDITEEEIQSLLEVAAIEVTMIDSPVDNLSGGEAQRVALARMLATKPDIVLLDEPTSALDPATSSVIENSVKRLAKDLGLCVVWVTHSPRQALRVGDETLLLVDGRLVEHGTPEDVINDPQSTEGKRYQNREM